MANRRIQHQLAQSIARHDRLERDLKREQAKLRGLLQRHQDATGRGGLPKLDVVRAEFKRAGALR